LGKLRINKFFDLGPTSDTPIEDIPFWARGHRNHSKKRSFKSLRLKKSDTQLSDIPPQTAAGNTPTISQGSFGGLFGRDNTSQAIIQTILPEQEKTTSDIPTPQELSSRTIPEVNVPDSIERRVYQRKSQPASDPQINTSFSMQIRRHERHISDSSIARPQPLALGIDEASHLEPHQSLRAVSKSTPSLGQQKRIEDMTEEEMMELAMKESAAIAPSSAYVGY